MILLASVVGGFATEPPDRGWYTSNSSGDYGIVEWNSKTYIAFRHHAVRVPLPLYPTLGCVILVFGAVACPIYLALRKNRGNT